MKIFSVVLNNFTSDNRVLKENISFKNAGFEPLIVAMHEDGLKELDEQEGIKIIRIKLKTKNWPKSFIFSAFKYFEFIFSAFKLSKNYDVVHCNDLETLAVGYFRKLISRKTKLVYDAHEYELEKSSGSGPAMKWLNRKMEKWFINSSNSVISVSDSIADEYSKIYGIQKPNLIFNCPSKSYYTNTDYDIFREKFNLRKDQNIFIYQGGFSKGRGIELIIEAFLSFEDDKNVVVFMGFGTLTELVKKSCENSNKIFHHEAVSFDEIVKHTKSADWGLITTQNTCLNNYMSLPNKFFEYAMADIPILAFPNIEMKNKIENYNIGLVTKSESAEDLALAIKEAGIMDKSSFSQGLEKIRSEFNWEKQEEKLIKIYKNL